eukprot:symbB.v1.2.016845.t1/scaffold1296.1/size126233/3
MMSLKAVLPLVSAFCAIGLFAFTRALCNNNSASQFQLLGARLNEDSSMKQVDMLRAEVYKGQTAILQALENLRVQVDQRPSTKDVLTSPSKLKEGEAPAESMSKVMVPVPVPVPTPVPVPVPTPVPVPSAEWPEKPKDEKTVLTGNGPVWDSKINMIEINAEKQYWYQRKEKNANIRPSFIKYNSNWPCLWGEEYTGQGQGDGNKWTCGARLIQAPCVVYSFGSNNNMQFEWGVYELGRNCEIHIFDPTSNAPPQLKSIGAKFHKVGLSGHDGMASLGPGRALPVKTLKTIMEENGHKHIDILKVDIEDGEHEAIPQLSEVGWPSIGQFLVEVHIRGASNDYHLDKFFQLVEKANLRLFHQEVNWEFGAGCCTEYAFIHKNWRPETKKYDMKQSASYQDIPLRGAYGSYVPPNRLPRPR